MNIRTGDGLRNAKREDEKEHCPHEASYSSCGDVFSFWRNWSVGIIVMQSHGQTWWHSVQPMQRGRSIVQTWNADSWRGPGIMLMQSTGQTVMHASQPVHMSSSSRASTLGSFFLAIRF